MPGESKEVGKYKKESEQSPSVQAKIVVGWRPVGLLGIIFISTYLLVFSIFIGYSLFLLWPPLMTNEASNTVSYSVLYFSRNLSVSYNVGLLIIVMLSGALGSIVHAMRSLYWYVGNRELRRSWLLKYIMLPFVGSSLALVFFFVVRGGFFSAQATIQSTSPIGFAALAGLVGLFSDQAVLKLKEVAETLLSKPQEGADAVPQEKPHNPNDLEPSSKAKG